METFQLDNVLAREYPIATITWSSAQAAGTTLSAPNFPNFLFGQTFIANKINQFKYFRAGMRVNVRIVSQKFQYGKLMINFCPASYEIPNFATNAQDPFIGSGFPHMLIDAAAGDVVSFDAPFISNKRAIDLNNYQAAEMGTFTLSVFNPLYDASTGAATTCQVFITAQFLEPELFLPVTVQSETMKKSSKGVISSVLDSATDVAASLSTVPLVSPYANIFSTVSRPVSGLLKKFGLSKPTTVAMTDVGKINPFADLNYGSGLDLAPKIAMSPENGISTESVVGGIDVDEMDLHYIAGTPQCIRQTVVSASTPPFSLGNLIATNTNAYCDIVSRMFYYHSGTYKFKFYITASQFHSVRLVFYLSTNTTYTHWENCYHKIVDVQGSTECEFQVPYLDQTVMTTNFANNNFYLMCAVISFVQPNATATTPIIINTYKAVSSDFQWGGLIDYSFVAQSNPRKDFQSVFDPIHPSMTGYEPRNLCLGETYKSLREVLHKYHPYFNESPLYSDYRVYAQTPYLIGTQQLLFGIEMWGMLFKYWRGSIRMKILQYDVGKSQCVTWNKDDSTYLVATTISAPTNPVLEAEIPYYYGDLFLPTRYITTAPIKGNVSQSNANSNYLMKSIGDDFSFHFLLPVMNGSFIKTDPTMVTIGQPGLQAFYQGQP